jgi:tripartite motif-containing protein 71
MEDISGERTFDEQENGGQDVEDDVTRRTSAGRREPAARASLDVRPWWASALILGAALLVSLTLTAAASANVSFTKAYGWGVSDGASQFETCTSTCQRGLEGPGRGQFNIPAGVATDSSGDVYVADSGNERIDEFSSTGSFIEAFGWGVANGMSQPETCTSTCQAGIYGSGAGQFADPVGVATDSSGDVYVADRENERIDEFSSSGSFIEAFGWGVANGMSQPETCTSTCQRGLEGRGAGQLYAPKGVAIDPSGHVYVADSGNERIDEFSAAGSFIQAYGWGVANGMNQPETCTSTSTCQAGLPGAGAGQFEDPTGVAIDSSGDVYVSDYGNARIDEFSTAGAFIEAFGWGVNDGMNHFEMCTTTCQDGIDGEGAGQIYSPEGVATDSSGDVYLADSSQSRIDEYGAGGAPSTTSTSLSGGGQSGASISVPESTAVSDTATLSGANASTATGTVTYSVYSDSGCTTAVSTGTAQSITTPGTLPASSPVTLSTSGTYYWQASYSGDSANTASMSTCGSEVETVTSPVVGSQAIAFTSRAPTTAVVGGPSYAVAATGGASGNPVTFSPATSGVCTVSGSTVSFVGAGMCTLDANQAGNSDYAPAPTATQSFAVAAQAAATGNIALDGSTITVQRNHEALIKLTCTGTATCSGRLTLTIKRTTGRGKKRHTKTHTIGTATFSIPAGTSETVKLTLNRTGRALLSAAHGHLSSTLTILKASPSPRKTQTHGIHLVVVKSQK